MKKPAAGAGLGFGVVEQGQRSLFSSPCPLRFSFRSPLPLGPEAFVLIRRSLPPRPVLALFRSSGLLAETAWRCYVYPSWIYEDRA
jgi:hypothetical protein